MEMVIKYVAKDGREFSEEKACLAYEKHIIPKPELLENPDLKALQNLCQEYIDFVDDDDEYHEDDDFDHHIFETAIQTFFGKDVWKWINGRRE